MGCRGAARLRQRFGNVELHTTTVLSAANAERMPEILAWIDGNLEAEVPEVLLVRGNPRDPRTLRVDLAQYAAAAERIRTMSAARAKGNFKNKLITTLTALMSEVVVRSEREQRMLVPCVAGGKLAVVRADGTVDPCEILASLVPPEGRPVGLESFALGNVRDNGYDLRAVARSAKATPVRRFIRDRRCHCTFECAIFASLIFGPRTWPRLGCRFLREWCR